MGEDRGGRAGLGAAVREALDDLPGAARDTIDAGRDLYRRGAIAVARTSGDGGALTMLAAGAAIAGVSWLLLRRRRGKTGA